MFVCHWPATLCKSQPAYVIGLSSLLGLTGREYHYTGRGRATPGGKLPGAGLTNELLISKTKAQLIDLIESHHPGISCGHYTTGFRHILP